jgi:hypothetical protein
MSLPWATLPTDWIQLGELRRFTWQTYGADATAALAIYVALVIKANRDGITDEAARAARPPNALVTTATYDVLQDYTLLSRSMVSSALKMLRDRRLVEPVGNHRARSYHLGGCRDSNRWAKLPQSPWYRGKKGLEPLRSFSFRSKTELTALKLYLLLATFRNNDTDLTSISYAKITEYSGIERSDIKRAISLLINHQLVHVLHDQQLNAFSAPYNAYRIVGFSIGPVRYPTASAQDFEALA